MSIVLNILTPLYLLIALGMYLRRMDFPQANFWIGVERLMYFILLPALIFSSLTESSMDLGMVKWLLLAVILPVCIAGALQFLAFKLLDIKPATFTAMFQGAVRGNTLIAIVIAAWLLPQNGVALMALTITVAVLFNNLVSVAVLAHYGDAPEGEITPKPLSAQLLHNPLILATFLGAVVSLSPFTLPVPLKEAMIFLGNSSLPLALLAIGASLRLESIPSKLFAIGWSSFARLILTPALCYLIYRLVPFERELAWMFLVYAAMPAAMSSYVLASQMGGDAETMAQIITVQTLVAALTLPVVLLLIQTM